MFDAFFSGGSEDASSRQPGSIGLGLAVSQRLTRLMGGDLRYARVGDETRFTLVLPMVPVSEFAGTA
jgi:signal transduction histidine kinase